MTEQLFKKAVTLTDIHFGRTGNSPVANQDNLDFIDWFIEEARTWGAETCLMLGDWHDNRHSLHVSTMHYSLEGMQKLNDAFKQVIWIPGNHDLLYRNKRDISSIEFARHLPNINVIREPTTIGGVTVLPWLVGDEHKMMKSVKSRYVFGHLELPGFMMNAKVPMPHSGVGIEAEDFDSINETEYVFSGHFHFRQAKGKVIYTGNPFPFNFADSWDEDRGMMFLEWGKEPEFKAWPDQPLFRTFTLSQLLNDTERMLKPKLTARCTLDIDISYEEAQLIKETFVQSHSLRKIELIHAPRDYGVQEFNEEVIFQSVDQIVVDGLLSVQSPTMKPDKLVEIYRSLPDL
jgi:DNA repair exonuclease SbcCD nuclease subunit